MDWRIEDDVLKFNGMYLKPVSPKTLAQVTAAYRHLTRQIAESELQISIIELQVEQHMVTGLFDCGDVTREMLARASHSGDCMSMLVDLGNDQIWMTVLPRQTHHDSFQFTLEGHPKGVTVVRDDLEL